MKLRLMCWLRRHYFNGVIRTKRIWFLSTFLTRCLTVIGLFIKITTRILVLKKEKVDATAVVAAPNATRIGTETSSTHSKRNRSNTTPFTQRIESTRKASFLRASKSTTKDLRRWWNRSLALCAQKSRSRSLQKTLWTSRSTKSL